MKNTFLFALINMFSGMGYSLVSPLFPSLGEKDHLSEELLGWIISAYSIAGTILTPFVPKLIKKYSRINLLCISAFFEATCTLLYGFLIYINSFPVLITIIFILRIIHGCCSAIIGTLVYSLTISLAEEDELQISLGNLEIAWSLGTATGPIFASVCYNFGGYSLPFYPCLTNHLSKNYGLSIRISSLFFVIPTVAYIFILQFLDLLTSKFGVYFIYILGLIFTAFSALFIYPCPPIPSSIIFIIFGFLINGLGSAPVFIPGLVLLSKNIIKIDPTINQLTANDISSAINNLTIDVGEFLGPIVGGFFTSRYDFKFCCFIIFIISISYSSIFLIYFYSNIKEDIININNEQKNVKDFIKMKKNIEEEGYDDLIPDNVSSSSLVQFSSGFLRGIKFESIYRRRNSYANMFRKRRLSNVSLGTNLTN